MLVNSFSQPSFQGVKTHKLSKQVKEAVEGSSLLQRLGKYYDISIEQYKRKVNDKTFGPLLEYGLRYRLREITPNLFHKHPLININYTSDYALSLLHEPNKTGKLIKQKQEMTTDLVKEIEMLTANDIKSWIV